MENCNLGVQLFWQSISLKYAKEHSTLAANTTQILPVLSLPPAAENGVNTNLHMDEISGCLAHYLRTAFAFPSPQKVRRGPMVTQQFHKHFKKA